MNSSRSFAEVLQRVGFEQVDGEWFIRGELLARRDGDWLSLDMPRDTGQAAELGQPGLWKRLADASGEHAVFDLPLAVLAAADVPSGDQQTDGAADDAPLVRDIVHWAEATFAGELPHAWQAPTASAIEARLGPGSLETTHAGLVCPARVVAGPGRLALTAVIGQPLGSDWPPARRACVERVLFAASNRCRMVRLGVDELGRVTAEVDLTGVPAAIKQPLCEYAAAALRHVVGGVLTTISILTDPRVEGRAWTAAVVESPVKELVP